VCQHYLGDADTRGIYQGFSCDRFLDYRVSSFLEAVSRFSVSRQPGAQPSGRGLKWSSYRIVVRSYSVVRFLRGLLTNLGTHQAVS